MTRKLFFARASLLVILFGVTSLVFSLVVSSAFGKGE